MSDGYNGWTNYETWCVNLWWNNDSGSQEALAEMARDCWGSAKETKFRTRSLVARRALWEGLKDRFTAEMPELETSLYSDLLTSVAGRVNWEEIANAALEALDLDGYESRSFLPA